MLLVSFAVGLVVLWRVLRVSLDLFFRVFEICCKVVVWLCFASWPGEPAAVVVVCSKDDDDCQQGDECERGCGGCCELHC